MNPDAQPVVPKAHLFWRFQWFTFAEHYNLIKDKLCNIIYNEACLIFILCSFCFPTDEPFLFATIRKRKMEEWNDREQMF